MNPNDIYTKEEICQHYVIANLHRLQKIIAPYKEQKQAWLTKEPAILHDDILSQYKKILRSVIAVDMAINLPITALDAILFMETVDVEQL